MNRKRHYLITLGVLLAALLSYILGFGLGAALFVILGAALELWFWIRTFRYLRSVHQDRS